MALPRERAVGDARRVSETAILVYESMTWEPATSRILVYGLDVALLGAIWLCLRATGRSRRALQHARASIVAGTPLAEGQRFVAGRVELAANEPYAVDVTVTQVGEERSVKNGKVHGWREIDRTVRARPFYLRHESGERVRVEPPDGKGVRLVDRLDQEEWTERLTRRKRAALTEGEIAYVEGEIARGHDPEGGASTGYREAATGFVLRPRRGQLHVSAEPLAHRHELRLRALERLFPLLLVGFLGTQAPLGTFWLRTLAGEDIDAPYLGKRTYTTRDSKGRANRHDVAELKTPGPDGQPLTRTVEVPHETWAKVLPDAPGRIAVRYVPHVDAATMIGRGAALGVGAYLLALIVGAATLFRLWRVVTHKRWYERPLVETGISGELPQPPGTRFALRDESVGGRAGERLST